MGPLITDRLLRTLGFIAEFGQAAHAHPYKWNREERTLTKSVERKSRKRFRLNFAVVNAYLMYVSGRMAFTTITSAPSETWSKSSVLNLFTLSQFFLMPWIQSIVLLEETVYLAAMRRLLTLFSELEEYYFKPQKRIPRSVRFSPELVQSIFIAFATAAVFLNLLLMYFQKDSSAASIYPLVSIITRFVFSGCSCTPIATAVNITIGFAFHSYIAYLFIGVACKCASFACTAFVLTMATLEKLQEKCHETHSIETHMLHFDQLRQLITGFSVGSTFAILMTQVVGITLLVLGTVYCIRVGTLFAFVTFYIGFCNFSSILLVIEIFANLDYKSKRILRQWMRNSHLYSKDSRKYLRTLRPINIRLGGMFYMDKLLVVTTCRIAIDWIQSTLLIF